MPTDTREYPPITIDAEQLARPESRSRSTVFALCIEFLRQRWPGMTLISALLLVPCFWHRYIVAGDLDSHMYNAWLVQLIERGQAPGLWIARQWNNIFFDSALSAFGNMFGLQAAEKIVVSLAVLLFFWGGFSLVAACTRHAPWFLTPVLAMLAYGWTFQMGFLNYYISLGLAFFALAIFWRGQGVERFLALPLAALIWIAHPLGLAFLIGTAVYIAIAENLPRRGQIILVSACAAGLAFVSWFLMKFFPGPSASLPGLAANGSNQLLLFEPRYLLPTRLLLAFTISCLLVDVFLRRNHAGTWPAYALPFQLYIVAILGISLLPDAVEISRTGAFLTLLTPRFSSICAIFVCCLLGAARPRKWHLIGFSAIAVIYFLFLYKDTAALVQKEGQAEEMVRHLPPGSRVMSTFQKPTSVQLLSNHIVDRACIGRCFSYGNYEPGSQHFRVRASPGNTIVAMNVEAAIATQYPDYMVPPQDPPMYEIYWCGRSTAELCMRELPTGPQRERHLIHAQPAASERNGALLRSDSGTTP